MNRTSFSNNQIDFLATLDAFQGPVPIKIIGTLSPLLPSELLDLLRRGKEQKLIYESKQDVFRLTARLPKNLKKIFNEINTKEKLNKICQRLSELNLMEETPLQLRANILERSGKEKEAAYIYFDIAQQAFNNEKYDDAYDNLSRVIHVLPSYLGENVADTLFVKACLEFCHLCDYFGRLLHFLPQLLEKAIKVTDRTGDKRSKAMLNFYMGHYYCIFGDTSKAIDALEKGRLIVEELGDEDIMFRSSGFIGFYYFILGLNREATKSFEQTESYFDNRRGFLYSPVFMAYSGAYSGHYDRAIGCLDYYWHLAKQMNRRPISATYRAILGLFLLTINKKEEAGVHLLGALELAHACDNEFAAFFAQQGLTIYYYKENLPHKAYDCLNKVFSKLQVSRLNLITLDPWLIEIMYDLEKQGYALSSEYSFENLYKHFIKENNIHLKGVILRLMAKNFAEKGEASEYVLKLLYESESCLQESSDPFQLAKTLLEIARLKINDGKIDEARALTMKARLSLSGHWEDLFPDDLRFLLEKEDHKDDVKHNFNNFMEHFVDTLGKLPIHHNIHRNQYNLLAMMNRLFNAERGAIFWLSPKYKKLLKPRYLLNMSQSLIDSEGFRSSMAEIIRCNKENQPILINNTSKKGKSNYHRPLEAICLPISIRGDYRGVLYHDNSYIEGCFDRLSSKILERVCVHIAQHINRIMEYNKLLETTKQTVVMDSKTNDTSTNNEIIASSPVMLNLLDQVDHIASTESTILIQGETGVGKELLAKRMHKMSPRKAHPFITVDSATISDNLAESELFGHEKGSFTGADRQKIGLVELADKGTLFIDEIGESPKSVQAKLLRVLQERTFMRVGGNFPISSDFRLLVATNRDLEDEVRQGRFREDLFYRLNTIPLTLPPLRERKEDIIDLSQHFLALFSKKYNKPNLFFTPEVEKKLLLYNWPGNIRELKNVIERAVILSKGERLELNLTGETKPVELDEASELVTLDEHQRRYIEYVLKKTGGKIYGRGGAAEILGINRGTLYARMRKLGLR